MLTVKNLIPVLDEFLIGDADSRTILPPEVIALDQVLDARVSEISAKEEVPIIWINLQENTEDYLDFEG